jgi:predicted DCC family thiol-disulfide oxidoreductase YuxK
MPPGALLNQGELHMNKTGNGSLDRPARSVTEDAPVLLYDGWCGFCAGVVQFILRHEGANRRLHFAPLDGALAARLRNRVPGLATVDSMILVLPGSHSEVPRVLLRSAAAIALGKYLGGPWRLAAGLASAVPRPISDRVYDLVARHRHRLRGDVACLVPQAEQRARFLD